MSSSPLLHLAILSALAVSTIAQASVPIQACLDIFSNPSCSYNFPGCLLLDQPQRRRAARLLHLLLRPASALGPGRLGPRQPLRRMLPRLRLVHLQARIKEPDGGRDLPLHRPRAGDQGPGAGKPLRGKGGNVPGGPGPAGSMVVFWISTC